MKHLKSLGLLLILLSEVLYSESSFTEELKLPIETGYETSVAWSSDSSKVAIGCYQRIYIVDASNGQIAKKIQAPGFILSIDWSPDGKKLAVSQKDEVTVHYPTDVWVVNVNDETMEKVTDSDIQFRELRPTHYRTPIWSPDGSFLVITVEKNDVIRQEGSDDLEHLITHNVVKLNLETRSIETIGELPLHKFCSEDECLSPDGERSIIKISTSLDHFSFILKKK